jgi:hypothetical protein
MNVIDLDLPDFSSHPPPPKLNFEQYERWICEEIVPALAREGKLTREYLVADFMRNEGSQTEEWPDFGASQSVPAVSAGSEDNEAG